MPKPIPFKIEGLDATIEVLNLDEKVLSPSPENSIDESFFTACDVYRTTGLSYRQLNNWDLKGVLPNSRGTETGWRTFSYREIFAILVCSDLRTRFGVPLESLKTLQMYLMREDIGFLGEALERISAERFALYLVTDLKESFRMISDAELQSTSMSGLFRGDEPAAFILLKLNPLVNKITRLLDHPFQLQTSSAAYEAIDETLDAVTVRNHKEREVLRLVREGDYDRISIQLKDGNIVSAETEKEISKSQQNRLLDILNNREFQTVTVTKHDGEIVKIKQKVTIKFLQTTGAESLHRQKDHEGRGTA